MYSVLPALQFSSLLCNNFPLTLYPALFDTSSPVWYIRPCLIHPALFDISGPVWYIRPCLIYPALFDTSGPVWYIRPCFILPVLHSSSLQSIAGHRHQGRCLWHGHSEIRHLNPVLGYSGAGLGPRHRYYFTFRCRTDCMDAGPVLLDSANLSPPPC
jgi:hypothetical protein